MNGQTTLSKFKEKQKIADDYIKKVNPYIKPEPLQFDLRGYSNYMKEHNIAAKDVTDDIYEKFQL